MTDHLDRAHEYILRALHPADALSGLMDLTTAVSRIFDHLEAQNTPQEATSADLTASQPEPDQQDGSDFRGRIAGRLADPEVLAGYLAVHSRKVREQIARELQHEAEAMTRFNAHPAMSTSDPTYREGIRVGLAAAARIARQEQP